MDKNRGNTKMDFGFACGQNLVRDIDSFGATKPRTLDRTNEPVFLAIQEQLSTLMDAVSENFGLPLYHRLDNIHQIFAQSLHFRGVIPAWRAATNLPDQPLEVHEDTNNDERLLMSPVGVFSRIYATDEGPIRLTKIGYSRQSLYDSIQREREIKPMVEEFKTWERKQPKHLQTICEELFYPRQSETVDGIVQIPCHHERSVGVSPYIHSLIHLQRILTLSRHHCVAVLYHCVTSESPYYFYSVYEDILTLDLDGRGELAAKHPIDLGLWFHERIWEKIEIQREKKVKPSLPRRHQPHNGKKPTDGKISMSITNLIRLTEEFCFLEGSECKKQYHHSKAIAILMKTPDTGGCHACGGLTSQTLLYTLACVGLVPICVARWGELANTETSYFLEQHYRLSCSEGRIEQFLNCCVSSSPGYTHEQIENRICKWIRGKKKEMKECQSEGGDEHELHFAFRDGIWPGQNVYQPNVNGKLSVWNKNGKKDIDPPAANWPNPRGKRSHASHAFWDQPTRSTRKRVLGGNRQKKRGREQKMVEVKNNQLCFILPDPLEIVFQAFCPPLYLSLPNLLGDIIGESVSLPKRRIKVQKKRRKGFRFSILDKQMKEIAAPAPISTYSCPCECRMNESLRFAIHHGVVVLSRYIFKLIDDPLAKKQLEHRDTSSRTEYLLVHCNDRRTKSKRQVVAVVTILNTMTVAFVLTNDKYKTERMEFVLLHRCDI